MLRQFLRVTAVLVFALVATDAAVCPVLCLAADAASHDATNLPTHGSTAPSCGTCSSGLIPVASYLPGGLVLIADQIANLAAPAPLAASDIAIYHPPRFV